jgi:hypothetical protein
MQRLPAAVVLESCTDMLERGCGWLLTINSFILALLICARVVLERPQIEQVFTRIRHLRTH